MRKYSWIFIVFLAAGTAEAQSPSTKAAHDAQMASRPHLDLNLNIGAFGAARETDTPHYNDWFYEGRYAASIGYYWTENLKTELEYAISGESTQYVQDWVRVPGTGAPFLLHMERTHRQRQASLRMVWQFFDNTWVHPYVNGGVVLDVDTGRYHVPQQYDYPTLPRTTPPQLVRAEYTSSDRTDYSVAGTLGAGAKFYVSPKTYLNTGMQASWGEFKTITLLAGFGVEF